MDHHANAQASKEQQQRLYEDFHPSAIWIKEEENTLEVHLHDFKKEQLRVQLDYIGNLRISGERPLLLNNGKKWRRFQMDFRVPRNFFMNQIEAKFAGGILKVKLPKSITRTVTYQSDVPTTKHKQTQEGPPNTGRKMPNDEAKISSPQQRESKEEHGKHKMVKNVDDQLLQGQCDVSENARADGVHSTKENNITNRGLGSERGYKFGIGGFEVKLERPNIWVLAEINVVMAATVVALGVYAICKFYYH